jgi:hypothetical protein
MYTSTEAHPTWPSLQKRLSITVLQQLKNNVMAITDKNTKKKLFCMVTSFTIFRFLCLMKISSKNMVLNVIYS